MFGRAPAVFFTLAGWPAGLGRGYDLFTISACTAHWWPAAGRCQTLP